MATAAPPSEKKAIPMAITFKWLAANAAELNAEERKTVAAVMEERGWFHRSVNQKLLVFLAEKTKADEAKNAKEAKAK